MPRSLAATALLLALAATAGCSSSSAGGAEGEGAEQVTVLSKDQLQDVLLDATSLAGSWNVDEDDEEDDTELGCLTDIGDLGSKATKAKHKAEISLSSEGDSGLPAVGHSVGSYESVAQAQENLDQLTDALDGCHSVEEKDADGTQMKLSIDTDTEKSVSDVDQQVNVTAVGSAGNEVLSLPIAFRYSIARIDNHLSLLFYADLTDSAQTATSSTDALVAAAVSRLRSVIAGDEPDAAKITVGENRGSGDDTTEGDGDAVEGGDFEQLPLDGGTHTWDNGVKLTLTVDRVEKWGDTDDFCGDGSCGIANPDDTRVVLKYVVSVPEDYPGPFDPSSCPGQLLPTSGSDDEALSGVAGDFDHSIEGKIFPGNTKFGTDEYYVEKAYADKEFYVESSCGSGDGTGAADYSTAYFVGRLAKTR